MKEENTKNLLDSFERLTKDYPLHAIEADGTPEEVHKNIMDYLMSLSPFNELFDTCVYDT